MIGYLDRLKTGVLEKQAAKELPKPPKAPYGSFDSSHDGHFQEIEANAATLPEVETAANRLCAAVGDDAERRAVMLADVQEFPPERWPWLIEYLNGEAAKHAQAALPGNDDDRRRCYRLRELRKRWALSGGLAGRTRRGGKAISPRS